MNLHIADVKEKEIDFLLAEEFASSASFLSFILDEFEEYKNKIFSVIQINRSHTDSYGESDLEVFLKDDGDNHLALLIENKVSAQFMNDQLLRYQKRGQAFLEQGKCDDYKIILVAPQDYGHFDRSDIDARFYYEDLIEWFSKEKDTDSRYWFKTELLNRALEKARQGYQPIEDKQTTRFWEEYWRLANQMAPQLNMPKPGKKPSASQFIQFAPSHLLSGLSLLHKVNFGVVDLQIAGLSKHIGEFKVEFTKHFESNYEIVKTGKSVSIRQNVPALDVQRPVSEQGENVKIGLREALKLYQWYRKNEEALMNLINKFA